MVKLFKIISFSFLALAILSACSTATTDPADLYKGESPQQIYQRGKTALIDRDYNEAIKRFEVMDTQYPYELTTANADLYLIYAYYKKGEYILASSAAERFIRMYPTDPHVDYAYYMRGLADFYQNLGVFERIFANDLAKRDLTQIQKAFVDFNELVVRFPTSRYTPAAHQYLIYLRNVLAKHELDVAKYYYNRQAYMAAANRASVVVTQFQGAPSVVDALVLMVKAYRQLHLTKLEQDTMDVLRYNYPDLQIDYDSRYEL